MIVVSKLNKPRKLKQVIHKDFRGSLTEIFLRKKIKFNFCKCITVTSKINDYIFLSQRTVSMGKCFWNN